MIAVELGLLRAIQPGLQQPDPHLAGVQAALVRRLVLDVAVRIPLFDRGVDEANVVLSAPAEHVERFDVPRQVDDDVARTHELAQHRLVVVLRQTRLFERHARLQRIRDLLRGHPRNPTTVIRSAGMSTWRRMSGSVHWPTDPQPSIRMRPLNGTRFGV